MGQLLDKWLDTRRIDQLWKPYWGYLRRVRNHRCRWAMIMYVPQATPLERGPTGVVPGSKVCINVEIGRSGATGDPLVIWRTIRMAKEFGVGVGAAALGR